MLGLAGHFHLDYGDGELRDDLELRSRIVELVRKLKPEVVICPDPTAVFFGDRYFNHSDHRVTGWATLDAVAPGAGNPHYFPEQLAAGLTIHSVSAVYLSGTLEPNCWVDIGDDIETKIDALFCHGSQLTETGEWFREFLRERAEEGGRSRRRPLRRRLPPPVLRRLALYFWAASAAPARPPPGSSLAWASPTPAVAAERVRGG